jgi:uncharacterized protein YndB with AHSA1/START domain
MSDDAIIYEVEYPHPIERVWRAITDAKALGQWLMPNDFVPELGHSFTFRTKPDQMWNGIVQCRVVELEPPHRLAYTWLGGNGLLDTMVKFTLTYAAGGTRLRLEHSGFAKGGPPSLTIRDIMASGWGSKLLFERLPALLEQLASEESGTVAEERA